MEKNIIPRKTGDFERIAMSDGTVIHRNEFIHTLNQTGLEIFDLCDGSLDVSGIIEEMEKIYSDENLETVIGDYLYQLHKCGLINLEP